MTTAFKNGADGATSTPVSAPLGFGANKFLHHQLKTGRLHTKGSGVPVGDSPTPAAEPSKPHESAVESDVRHPASGTAVAPAAPRPMGFARAAVALTLKQADAPAQAQAPVPAPVAPVPAPQPSPIRGFSRAPESGGQTAAPAAAPASGTAPAAEGFAGAVASQRVASAAKAHISTVKLLTRLLGAVAARPGIMAEEHVRSSTLRDLHRQTVELGTALAERCVENGRVPDWLRAQATEAAASTLCMAWEGGMSADKIKDFNESMAQQLGVLAADAEAIAGRVGFDGYAVADTTETAQARIYVSVTAALGRLIVVGVPPLRAAQCVAEVVDYLQSTENHAGLKLDLRTAWLQGSLGRCTDLIVAVLQSQTLVPGGEDRLTFAQRQALSLFQEVENYAQQFINRKASQPIEHVSEGQDSDPGPVPGGR
jgi:hypothetical protein